MRKLKHLPLEQWPEADLEAFRTAYEPGDVFDETGGPGAHLAEGTRKLIRTAYRRWLGFLKEHYPDDLLKPPADRVTPARVRAFIDHLSAEIRPTSVANAVDNLGYAARLITPRRDWQWLAALKARLAARARPEDRFDRLVQPWQTLDFGIELMDEALTFPSTGHKRREIQYRDGLLLALLSLWPIRRRSIAALTVGRHLEFDAAGVNILLYPEDTKAKRAESFRVPEPLLPYLLRYLKEIRPRLLGRSEHDGLWASYGGRPLIAGRIYDILRARIADKFGKAMGLHDFRRAASTYVAMDAPDKIGLIPGVLQHASPDVSERHYNLARSVQASRRFAAYLSKIRAGLAARLHAGKKFLEATQEGG
jgi:integrase/recombinase XerD